MIYVLNGRTGPAGHPGAGSLRQHHLRDLVALCSRAAEGLGLPVECDRPEPSTR